MLKKVFLTMLVLGFLIPNTTANAKAEQPFQVDSQPLVRPWANSPTLYDWHFTNNYSGTLIVTVKSSCRGIVHNFAWTIGPSSVNGMFGDQVDPTLTKQKLASLPWQARDAESGKLLANGTVYGPKCIK